jgi:U3 small nucleolar RNA-associated protein 5
MVPAVHRHQDEDPAAQRPAKRPKTLSRPAPPSSGSRLDAAVFTNGTARKLVAAPTNGVKGAKNSQHHVDSSRTVISKADGHGDVGMPDSKPSPPLEVVEISSDEGSDEDNEDDQDEQNDGDSVNEENGHINNQAEADSPADPEVMDVDSPHEEATFGELLQNNPIDVESSFAATTGQSSALALAPRQKLAPPSAISLGTVLTQALRTNDKDLLESCFEMNDLESVRSTVERLDSPLVATLLHKLAERLHKRPGRAGSLMVWVQWALVSHGGYLAGKPDILQKLGPLNRVIKERANGLQPLLTLKGKLDMLSAQLELRRSMQARSRSVELDDDEGAVIYVEGEEDEVDDTATISRQVADSSEGEDEGEDDDGRPTVNGIEMEGVTQAVGGAADDDNEDSEDDSSVEDDDEASDEGFSDQDVDDDSDAGVSDEDSEEDIASPEPVKRSLAMKSQFAK